MAALLSRRRPVAGTISGVTKLCSKPPGGSKPKMHFALIQIVKIHFEFQEIEFRIALAATIAHARKCAEIRP
jgi:hypothetical protein